jgi:hypothetical protein
MKSFSVLLPVLALAAQVTAHGFLSQVTINGKAYNGPKPGQPASASATSAIRGVSSPDPNKGASNVALTCGPDAVNGGLVASAMPGDKLTFSWKGADGSNWPHNTGPMLTYMASCGSTTCDKFDDSQAKWFKISQDGRETTGQKNWMQQELSECLFHSLFTAHHLSFPFPTRTSILYPHRPSSPSTCSTLFYLLLSVISTFQHLPLPMNIC